SGGRGARRRHDPGQQAIGELARQRQAPGVERGDVVAGGGRLNGMHRRGHLAAPQRRGMALDTRERAGVDRCALVLRELAHQHVLQADAAALAGHAHGQLLVVHVAVLLDRLGVHRVVGGQHVAGLARGLEHLADEQRLELLGHLAYVGVAVAIAMLERAQAVEVGVGAAVDGAGNQALGVHAWRPQITIRSACKAPACFRASRIAIRSLGAAPTWFTARTISSSVVPGPNLNIGLASCSALTRERGTTAVWPLENGPGWLTIGSSVMVTVRLPWVTAAGETLDR